MVKIRKLSVTGRRVDKLHLEIFCPYCEGMHNHLHAGPRDDGFYLAGCVGIAKHPVNGLFYYTERKGYFLKESTQ